MIVSDAGLCDALSLAGQLMNKMRAAYFEKEDILHLMVAGGPEVQSVELSPDITVEIDAEGHILGVEILNASQFMRDLIMDSKRWMRHSA